MHLLQKNKGPANIPILQNGRITQMSSTITRKIYIPQQHKKVFNFSKSVIKASSSKNQQSTNKSQGGCGCRRPSMR